MITPGGPVPGHLCLYVDGLGTAPLLVDPGFGDSPRVPLPATFDKPVTDRSYGDRYTLVKNDGSQFGQAAEHAKRVPAEECLRHPLFRPGLTMTGPERFFLDKWHFQCILDTTKSIIHVMAPT